MPWLVGVTAHPFGTSDAWFRLCLASTLRFFFFFFLLFCRLDLCTMWLSSSAIFLKIGTSGRWKGPYLQPDELVGSMDTFPRRGLCGTHLDASSTLDLGWQQPSPSSALSRSSSFLQRGNSAYDGFDNSKAQWDKIGFSYGVRLTRRGADGLRFDKTNRRLHLGRHFLSPLDCSLSLPMFLHGTGLPGTTDERRTIPPSTSATCFYFHDALRQHLGDGDGKTMVHERKEDTTDTTNCPRGTERSPG